MPNVIPAPLSVSEREGAPFLLSAATPVVATSALAPLARWFVDELAVSTGISPTVRDAADGPSIRVELVERHEGLAGLPETGGLRADGGDPNAERHAIEIGEDGVSVQALAPEGIFRGLTTLLQIAATEHVDGDEVALPALAILDAPRFAWRGFSLDVVRRFSPVEEVERVIDLLALYKANVLHLHLTDSEGWRIEIDAWPRLGEVSSQTAAQDRPGGMYTKEAYAGLVRYAAERFITIVPEIEMPGHAAAIYRAYPELAGNGVDPATANLDKAPWFQVLRPDNPRVMPFLRDVLGEVAALTPGAYLHIGGDEALGMDPALYREFMQEAKQITYGLGKRVVAWQETARSGFQPGDVAQLWISPEQGQGVEITAQDLPEGFELPVDAEEIGQAFGEFLKLAAQDLDKALEQGASILVSQQSRTYLDTKYREESADPAQVDDHHRLGMPFYATSTVAEFYTWDPATIREELDESRIAGVEAAIWCETIETEADRFFLTLPRLPGVLEKGWSAAAPEEAAWADYAPRLAAQATSWERRGWRYFRSAEVWPGPA
ncbi:MAG TPA: family 20 glycosylhydrolase [Thermomicrobiales bacterium]|nr:family 20 glycosylhydrolase [Thermomicrobiales bacterium]